MIIAFKGVQEAFGEGLAGDAVEAVAAGDKIAWQFVIGIGVAIRHAWPGRFEIVQFYIPGVKEEPAFGGEGGGDEVLEHFVLA